MEQLQLQFFLGILSLFLFTDCFADTRHNYVSYDLLGTTIGIILCQTSDWVIGVVAGTIGKKILWSELRMSQEALTQFQLLKMIRTTLLQYMENHL